jgi:hypothetical protein
MAHVVSILLLDFAILVGFSILNNFVKDFTILNVKYWQFWFNTVSPEDT